MKSRFFIGFLSVFCFSFILFSAFPVTAYEPLKGKQLALKGINADDAEPAIDDEVEMIDGMGCFRDGTQVSGDKRITAEKEFDVVRGA